MGSFKIGYIGSSYKMAECIYFSNSFELDLIICEKDRVNKDIILFSELFRIPIFLIESEEDMHNVLTTYKHLNNYIMYNFGIILTSNILDIVSVYNIHPGSIQTNRGRNAIENSILRNDRYTEIVLHQVTTKIDSGRIISKKQINISLYDDSKLIKEKLEKYIPYLLIKLHKFLLSKTSVSEIKQDGKYLKRIQEKDYIIDLQKDTISDIYNKIKSQKCYNGALLKVDGYIYRVSDLLNVEYSTYVGQEVLFNNNQITFYKGTYKITLQLCEVL